MSESPRVSLVGLLGKGWPFPVMPDPESHALEFVAGPDKVRQSIHLILETEPGERIMRPGFGCGLRRYLMSPNTVSTRALIRREVERALSTWEPRIQLQEVDVDPGDDSSLVLIAIRYLHAADQRPENLVYPFYLA
jgi:phage baseplate assembly protein W